MSQKGAAGGCNGPLLMSSQFLQSHPDGQCLRYPEQIPPQREVTYEAAVNMLLRAMNMAQGVPFSWGFVDKPQDGTVMLLYLPSGAPYPNDGIRYQEPEVKIVMPAGARELEACEIKSGFIPGAGEPNASRIRRRYRLLKGGNPQLVLVHYTRGAPTLIQPGLMNQPVRVYPLRPVNEPSVYVSGEKQGQKVFPPGMHPGPGQQQQSMAPAAIGTMNFNQQQAMLAQQNSQMEALERRRDRERERAVQQGNASAGRPQQRQAEEDDSGDEVDQISTRTLALARYKRNHDWMNEVFHYAAFGNRSTEPKPSPYSTVFPKTELEEKTAKLQAELDALQSTSAQRRADKIRASQNQDSGDMSMGMSESSPIAV